MQRFLPPISSHLSFRPKKLALKAPREERLPGLQGAGEYSGPQGLEKN